MIEFFKASESTSALFIGVGFVVLKSRLWAALQYKFCGEIAILLSSKLLDWGSDESTDSLKPNHIIVK